MFHEKAFQRMRTYLSEEYHQRIQGASKQHTLEALYEEYFVERRDAKEKRLFAHECVRLLTQCGDEYPTAFDDAIYYALEHPTQILLNAIEELRDCFSQLSQRRRDGYLEALYRCSLIGIFRNSGAVNLESFRRNISRMTSAFEERLTRDLRETLQQANATKKDPHNVERWLDIPASGSTVGYYSKALLCMVIIMHSEQLTNAKMDKLPYDRDRQLRIEELIQTTIIDLLQCERETIATHDATNDDAHFVLRWFMYLLPMDERKALLTASPNIEWMQLASCKRPTVAEETWRKHIDAYQLTDKAKYKSIDEHARETRYELYNFPWKEGAWPVYIEAPEAIRAEMRHWIMHDNWTYKLALNQSDLPKVIELIEADDACDEHLLIELQATLHEMPREEARDIVDAAYASAKTPGKMGLLRQYTTWSLLDGNTAQLDTIAEKETDPDIIAAIQLAYTRLQPDWMALYKQYRTLVDNPEEVVFSDPLREAELRRTYETLRSQLIQPMRQVPGTLFEPLLMYYVIDEIALTDNRLLLVSFEALAAEYSTQLHEPAVIWLENQEEICWEMYRYISQRTHLSAPLHLFYIRNLTGKRQIYASQKLGECGEEGYQYSIDLLRNKKASMRLAGIRALQCAGRQEAVGPLEKALPKERSKKCKEAIVEAIAQCQKLQEKPENIGIYRRKEQLDELAGLAQLREVLYAEATEVSWVRVCDLINRLRGTSSCQIAIDYLRGHDLSQWQDEMRIIPWNWDEPELIDLGHRYGHRWVPASVFFSGQCEDFLDETLAAIENNRQKRKLPRQLIPTFIQWIEVAWHWCQQHDLPLEWLQARLDGGTYGGGLSQPGATHLTLFRQFGFCLERGLALSDYIGFQDIYCIWLTLPKEHPYRNMYPLRNRRRYLDIRDVYHDLASAQKALGLSRN